MPGNTFNTTLYTYIMEPMILTPRSTPSLMEMFISLLFSTVMLVTLVNYLMKNFETNTKDLLYHSHQNVSQDETEDIIDLTGDDEEVDAGEDADDEGDDEKLEEDFDKELEEGVVEEDEVLETHDGDLEAEENDIATELQLQIDEIREKLNTLLEREESEIDKSSMEDQLVHLKEMLNEAASRDAVELLTDQLHHFAPKDSLLTLSNEVSSLKTTVEGMITDVNTLLSKIKIMDGFLPEKDKHQAWVGTASGEVTLTIQMINKKTHSARDNEAWVNWNGKDDVTTATRNSYLGLNDKGWNLDYSKKRAFKKYYENEWDGGIDISLQLESQADLTSVEDCAMMLDTFHSTHAIKWERKLVDVA